MPLPSETDFLPIEFFGLFKLRVGSKTMANICEILGEC